MTTLVVLAGDTHEDESFAGVLSSTESGHLREAMLADVCELVQHGEADLLVNYADGSKAQIKELLDSELNNPDAVRYEPQVGSSRSARIGNALTHLIEQEGAATVGVVDPTAVFLRREHIGTLAMKLRMSDVVVGPAPDGRLTLVGMTKPFDFTDVYNPPALETVTERATGEQLDVDFLAMTPLVDSVADLRTAIPLLNARHRAGRAVPVRTTARIEQWGLAVSDGEVVRSEE